LGAGAGDTSSVWLGAQDVVTDHRGAAREGRRGPLEAARDVAHDMQMVKIAWAAKQPLGRVRFFALAWRCKSMSRSTPTRKSSTSE
jgi:hypothetical protein